MSDFGDPDDMLLALAGGGDGSSDDEASNAGSRRSRRSSRSRSRGRSQSAGAAESSPQRITTGKKGPMKSLRDRDESEDEGEAYVILSNTLQRFDSNRAASPRVLAMSLSERNDSNRIISYQFRQRQCSLPVFGAHGRIRFG